MTLTGTIKRLIPDKGFGFIFSADTETEYFFHRHTLVDQAFETLQVGALVRFEVGDNARGPRAEHVTLA